MSRRLYPLTAKRFWADVTACHAVGYIKADLCCWCGRKPITPTWEHIVPKADQGGGGYKNLTVACHKCNVARDRTSIVLWMLALHLHNGDKHAAQKWCNKQRKLGSMYGN